MHRRVLIVIASLVVAGGCTSRSSTAGRSSSTTSTPTTTATTSAGPAVHLAIGDGKVVTDAPKKGYVLACAQGGGGPGGGAFRDGPWIKGDGTWVPSEKPHVQGSVSWPQAGFGPSLEGATRHIAGNGLPV
ncbi:MAG: hypothetical protein QOG03_2675, partial [Actinomycetota bacterium]|nr:hypothetical protein [Actinomycetota bacterium]